jgi:hypothetical protein
MLFCPFFDGFLQIQEGKISNKFIKDTLQLLASECTVYLIVDLMDLVETKCSGMLLTNNYNIN